MDFRITYLIEDRWVAGIQNLRMPVALPDGFGPRESMSFFLYNQDGHQAIARPFLDGRPATGRPGPSPVDDWPDMPRYHELASFDTDTNAPSSNFIYDFEYFQFMIRQSWREVLSHDDQGTVLHGHIDELADAFADGDEVFVHLGACYYYTDQKLFLASANPVVRTRPSVPLGYGSESWDFGWLVPRTDGHVARWLCDPYTLKFQRDAKRHAIRWFVSD